MTPIFWRLILLANIQQSVLKLLKFAKDRADTNVKLKLQQVSE